jgi:hypothetical protein
MKARLKRIASPSLVISVLALVFALGGVAYGVAKAPKNSVVTKSIRKGAVTLPKIAKGAQAALKGQAGAPGAPGANGATNVVVRTKSFSVGAGLVESEKFHCFTGERATGGGIADPPGLSALGKLTASAPVTGDHISLSGETPDGWLGAAFNGGAATVNYTIYVVCAKP